MYGWRERGEDVVDRPFFDDAARVHHDDAVGEARDHAEVVGDEQEREAEVAAEVGEQLEDLGLGRDVERGGGLVGDEHARSVGERHREHHPLAEAAGELVRVRARAADRVGDADRLEEVDRPQLGGAARHARLVHHDRLGHLVADALHRVERGHRVLEHHRQLAAAQLAVVAVGEADQRAAVEAHVATGDAPGRVDEPHHRERGHGLARARLPHHRDGLARGERERHAVDRRAGGPSPVNSTRRSSISSSAVTRAPAAGGDRTRRGGRHRRS